MEIPLSPRLESLILEICRVNSTATADAAARKRLAEIDEEAAAYFLNKILCTTAKVRNLSGYIVSILKKSNDSTFLSPPRTPPPPPSPLSGTSTSPGSTSSDRKRRRVSESPEEVHSIRRVLPVDSPTSTPRKFLLLAFDTVLDALERLEFWKAFLILSYCGGSKLEEVVSLDKIQSYETLTTIDFERHIWNDFGRDCCREQKRINITTWRKGDRANYHCHVDLDGNYTFKGPFLEKAATLMQKTIGDENVMVVKFVEEEIEAITASSVKHCPAFNKVAEEGIFVGRKWYRFFVFKDGGKEEKMKDPTSSPVKCFFICTEGFAGLLGVRPEVLRSMPMEEARGIFMHIHQASSLSNYMARFSLILSKTITLELNWNDVDVVVIDDIPCLDGDGKPITDNGKPVIFTDGTGFISKDLALRCPHNCLYGRVKTEETVQVSSEVIQFPHNFSISTDMHRVPPLLIQFRMFHKGQAIKGTVLVNSQLPPRTIQVRKSMVKVPTDTKLSGRPTKNSFEIVATSNQPKVACLSKNLIALLHYGGVPKEFFLALLSEALKKPLDALYNTKAALKVAVNWDYDDEFIAARMVASGIPLDEPVIQQRLSVIAKEEMKSLKAGKLPVSDSFYVMGTADPTGTLNSGEVCVIVDHGQLSGPVLVYRNPGLHPGDVHVVKARYVEALKDIVGDAKYGIIFPSKGARPMGDEFAGGDYDGDMYWVSYNPELLKHFRPSEPWKPKPSPLKVVSEKPNLPTGESLEHQLFRLFVKTRIQRSSAMGVAADCWLSYMDRILTLSDAEVDEKAAVMQKINELIDIYYDALDAPKKGKTVEVPRELKPLLYPHHMGKGEDKTYKSESILGQIHNIVDGFSAPVKVWKLKNFEAEIPEMYYTSWKFLYSNYKADMQAALRNNDESKNTRAADVYLKYRKEIYGGVDDPDMSDKSWKQIRLEALALYHVCYDHAIQVNDPKKCGFAWKVAGDALCKIFMKSNSDKQILIASEVLKKICR